MRLSALVLTFACLSRSRVQIDRNVSGFGVKSVRPLIKIECGAGMALGLASAYGLCMNDRPLAICEREKGESVYQKKRE